MCALCGLQVIVAYTKPICSDLKTTLGPFREMRIPMLPSPPPSPPSSPPPLFIGKLHKVGSCDMCGVNWCHDRQIAGKRQAEWVRDDATVGEDHDYEISTPLAEWGCNTRPPRIVCPTPRLQAVPSAH